MGDVDYLYETPETGELRVDPQSGKSFRAKAQPVDGGASLSGPTPKYSSGMMGSEPHPVVARVTQENRTRRYSPEELMAAAEAMEQQQMADHIRYQPSVNPGQVAGDQPPVWLSEYMSRQPTSRQSQFGKGLPETGSMRNKYMSAEDEEKLKKYRALRPESRK